MMMIPEMRMKIFIKQWRIHNFPGGGTLASGFGPKTIIWQDFCWKLHENERNWPRRGVRVSSATMDPKIYTNQYWKLLVSSR